MDNDNVDPQGNHHVKIIDSMTTFATTTFATAFSFGIANVCGMFKVKMYISTINYHICWAALLTAPTLRQLEPTL